MKGRGPVVRLDRSAKARMIEKVLQDFRGVEIANLKTLDIGCGNGGISCYFAQRNEHASVDIVDQRKPPFENYTFALTSDEILPFEDDSFDVVISNHVIEHVTDHLKHLSEIRRVLAPGGSVYLATPNKSSPIMEGHIGNDMVLRYRQMTPLFQKAGFQAREYGLRVAAEPVRFNGEVAWAKHIPKTVLKLMRPLFPSHIFVLTDMGAAADQVKAA